MADPDIEIQRPAGHANEIIHTGTDNLGSQPYGTPIVLTYTIANVGIEIDSFAFPDVDEGTIVDETMTAQGGIGAQTWSLDSGALPDGLTLETDTGQIHGTVTAPGTFSWVLLVEDEDGHSDTESQSMIVNAITRPASTRLLLIADPDAALVLSGSNITAFKEQADAAAINFTYQSGTHFTRQAGGLDGFSVARDAGAYCEYRSPNSADGYFKKWIDSDGSNVAASGCFVLVFKPTGVDDGEAILSCWNLSNVKLGMVNDGADKLQFAVRNTGGGVDSVKVACALDAWHYAIMRWDTTHIYLSIDGGAESSTEMGSTGGVTNMNARASFLSSAVTGSRFDGDMMELSIIDPADMADMISFLEYNYPTLA